MAKGQAWWYIVHIFNPCSPELGEFKTSLIHIASKFRVSRGCIARLYAHVHVCFSKPSVRWPQTFHFSQERDLPCELPLILGVGDSSGHTPLPSFTANVQSIHSPSPSAWPCGLHLPCCLPSHVPAHAILQVLMFIKDQPGGWCSQRYLLKLPLLSSKAPASRAASLGLKTSSADFRC